MTLAAPIQLAWAIAALAVLALYVRWTRGQRQPTATLPLWRKAFARRTRWSRWRRAASAGAACLIVFLLALALARPMFQSAVQSARHVVIVVDAAARMNVGQGDDSRLAQAKRIAHRQIDRMSTYDKMAILSADTAVRARTGLTGDRRLLHAAVDSIRPTDGAGAMQVAVAAARRLVADKPRPLVIVVSDGRFVDEPEAGAEVLLAKVGAPADNVGITQLALRPQPGDTKRQQALIGISNFSAASRDVLAELKLGEAPPMRLTMRVAPGETT
ncbi:MAG: VWA domain-containing protein, partial [Planctomycetales bacterium]|nr:VWA domain-containing protein [Planctomycetales bacterium]